ncbi:MAG: indolepyruvate oxidoreductase subunit beta family protein [Novosphingobium sp.]
MAQRPADRAIKIAIIAMGGQGGGVLSKWIIDLAQDCGYVAQYTSVPGVAQRTGATIYYIELFPLSLIEQSGKEPVLALTPVEGDVDIVVASEMMEVGRAVMRGFVTAKTTLIGSSHRDYAIVEKLEPGDGRRPSAEVDAIARETAARYICCDMDSVARESGAVISAVLFGALCASAALPFGREQFEETIRKSGKAVALNLKGLAAGIEAAGGMAEQPLAPSPTPDFREKLDPALAALVGDLRTVAPDSAFDFAIAGLSRVIDFQDLAYGRDYVERLRKVRAVDRECGGQDKGWALTGAMARYLALAMAYEDVIRVADIKTHSGRFETFRSDVRAEPGQVVRIREFMHPRWQEVCEILPKGIGRRMLASKAWNRMAAPFFGKGRRIPTTSLWGFTLLFLLGRMRWMRRGSLRFAQEQARIAEWFDGVLAIAPKDYALAVEVAGLQRLIKGYGDTHARSLANFERIARAVPAIAGQDDAAAQLRKLKQAALADEAGAALGNQIEPYEAAA